MRNEIIIDLANKFNQIKKLGYIKSTRNGVTGIGKTFEDYLGKNEDNSPNPDYKGIEIKTHNFYSKSYITLFCSTPKGNSNYEIKRIRDKYGYPDKIIKEEKVFSNSVYANKLNLISNNYYFKLKINYQKKKIFLIILNNDFEIEEDSVYWDFNDLKERLENKMNYLALIDAFRTTKNHEIYYKYTKIKFFKLKNFNCFLNLLENGKIRVTFKIGVHRSGIKCKEILDHGTGFEIKEENLLKLFDSITIN